MLTDALIKGFKPIADARYSKADGGGLLLDVTQGGVKSWVFRYRLNGKRDKVVTQARLLKRCRHPANWLSSFLESELGIPSFLQRALLRTESQQLIRYSANM